MRMPSLTLGVLVAASGCSSGGDAVQSILVSGISVPSDVAAELVLDGTELRFEFEVSLRLAEGETVEIFTCDDVPWLALQRRESGGWSRVVIADEECPSTMTGRMTLQGPLTRTLAREWIVPLGPPPNPTDANDLDGDFRIVLMDVLQEPYGVRFASNSFRFRL